MKRSIKVFLGDTRRVGTLLHEAHGARESAAFTYDEAWLAAADGFAVDPSLPLVAGPQFHRPVRDGSLFHGVTRGASGDSRPRSISTRFPSGCAS